MMDQILDNCEGIIGITDDIFMHGKDDAEHDRRLHKFMKLTRKHKLVLNKRKCEVSSDSVNFFGYVYDKHRAPPISIKGQYHQGDACIQDDGPVVFTSKALTPTEHYYVNNERELLTCVFSAEHL